MKPISYLLLRLALGASLFFHGLVRIPKITAFSSGLQEGFQETLVPAFLAGIVGYAIPPVEFLLGLLLLLGAFTQRSAFGAGMLMVVLISGSCLQENWGTLPSQFIHLAFAVLLYEFGEKVNPWSVDRAMKRS